MNLSTDELLRLIDLVFRPGGEERRLALFVDLPDRQLPDHPAWTARRQMVLDWKDGLDGSGRFERVSLVLYPNVHSNNADLPRDVFVHDGGAVLADETALDGRASVALAAVLDAHPIVIAPTELSATAPMKLLAPRHGFRAATMPGFTVEMIPALRLDWEEIQAQCVALAARLDRAAGASAVFEAAGEEHRLYLDLRHRRATPSGGLVREPGTAGNLPSGETYIVPYEGEQPGDASRTAGRLPLELDGELMVLEIEHNRVRRVRGDGPAAREERGKFALEPAYTNLAELGLGVLAPHGIEPVGEMLLDEKLGLHIAFGRSDHFGGQVGAADFTSPERVVHTDRIYIPAVQPSVRVVSVDLEMPDEGPVPLMRDGVYV